MPIPNISVSVVVLTKGSEDPAKNVLLNCVARKLQSVTIKNTNKKRKHTDEATSRNIEEKSRFRETPFTLAPSSTSVWELSLQPNEVDQVREKKEERGGERSYAIVSSSLYAVASGFFSFNHCILFLYIFVFALLYVFSHAPVQHISARCVR